VQSAHGPEKTGASALRLIGLRMPALLQRHAAYGTVGELGDALFAQ